jgi:hypothetical protein
MAIHQLLLQMGADGIDRELVMVEPHGLEVAADWRTLQTPETYLGYRQSNGFVQEAVARSDEAQAYAIPERLPLNAWGLSGTWTVAGHATVLDAPGGRIAFRFHARDVNLVMGPRASGVSIPFRVFLDGELVGNAAGTDVNSDGSAVVRDQRTYQLVRQLGLVTDRTFEIEFLDAGVEAYCFTFG